MDSVRSGLRKEYFELSCERSNRADWSWATRKVLSSTTRSRRCTRSGSSRTSATRATPPSTRVATASPRAPARRSAGTKGTQRRPGAAGERRERQRQGGTAARANGSGLAGAVGRAEARPNRRRRESSHAGAVVSAEGPTRRRRQRWAGQQMQEAGEARDRGRACHRCGGGRRGRRPGTWPERTGPDAFRTCTKPRRPRCASCRRRRRRRAWQPGGSRRTCTNGSSGCGSSRARTEDWRQAKLAVSSKKRPRKPRCRRSRENWPRPKTGPNARTETCYSSDAGGWGGTKRQALSCRRKTSSRSTRR